MRIWDVHPKKLCRNHLLGEHRELHAIWSILIQGKRGYSRHPETLRWKGKLKALYLRHQKLAEEMKKRSYNHASPLNSRLACGRVRQAEFLDSHKDQIKILRNKKCSCKV